MKIEINKLGFSYGGHSVLRDVNLTVADGEFIALLGANGAGKTTLFKCLLGLRKGYQGSICIEGADIKALSAKKQAELMAYIPQSNYPSFNYSVLDMVLMGSSHELGAFRAPGREQEERALTALAKLGIRELAEKGYKSISGGEQQLTLIARALTQNAGILVMDEPTSSLDFGNQLRVLESVRGLSKQGYTVLLSSHNPQHAMSFADRIVALKEGTIIADGTPGEVMDEKLLSALYGVEVGIYESEYGRVVMPKHLHQK